MNKDVFPSVHLTDYLKIMGHSFRFDVSVAITLLLPYLVFALLPFRQLIIRGLLTVYFLFISTISFLFEISDIAYFPYVRKRMTADVLHLLGQKADFINLLPSYLTKFWFVPLLVILLITSFYVVAIRIVKRYPVTNDRYKGKDWLFYLLIMALSILGIRGSFGLKPIVPNTALIATSAENTALVYNTSFSLLHSIEDQHLKPVRFMSDDSARKYYTTVRNYYEEGPVNKDNVVIIILESFGKMYTGLGGRRSYTPFLDSLCRQGLVCTKAFANASTSATGIPAILAGIPNFYNEPYTTSPYGRNRLDALGNLLKSEGYSTSFYHGGTNGTMSFNIFSALAGFDKYVGRNEYPDTKDYDGTWGISDLPFLSFYADQLSAEQQPFLSSFFTLSSHEPFSLPDLNIPSIDTLKGIKKGIRYTDFALQKFFEKASKQAWYKNTLFVITADHNYMAGHDEALYYNNGLGMFAIPVLYFHPDVQGKKPLKGVFNEYTQQIDILPSIIDYMNIPITFSAFGYSVFTKERHFAYSSLYETNLFASDDTLVFGSENQLKDMFNLKADSYLSAHIPMQGYHAEMMYKAFLQTLHQCIINDSMKYVHSEN